MTYSKLYIECDEAIEAYITSLEGIPEPLFSAMKYSVLNGGKRLRPVLALIGAKAGNPKPKELMKLAIAVELIHCYSLVHDDLPSMDNGTLRRGKPTTHIKFNEPIALLCGDALLNQAYEILSELSIIDNNFAYAAAYITRQAGSIGMIAGQCLDIINITDIKEILKMYSLKTSCLFKAALVGGAIASGVEIETNNKLKDFAYNLGIAYQIADDILDFTSTDEILGKNTGVDQNNNKPTYLNIVGLEEAVKSKKIYEDKALEAIFGLKIEDELLQISDMLMNRQK